MKRVFLIALSLSSIIIFKSCKKKDNAVTPPPPPVPTTSFSLGWSAADDPSSVPANVTSFTTAASLPSSYDLSQYLPPIGDQGNYGTCVAWSVGYYSKSATEAVALNKTTADLTSPGNEISPKDLFTAIADNKKGASNCNGTNFVDALAVLQNRGGATLQVVPYSTISSCYSSNVQPSWTTSANQHKIKYYRRIEQSVTSIKTQIASKFPVMIGAKVYTNFFSWNGNNVYSSFSGNFEGYHAMTIVGYDNSRGSGGAFKLANSWSTAWGASGYVWVDYNFLVNQFCSNGNLYIMVNENGNTSPPPPPTNSSGVDLSAWVFTDFSNYSVSGILNQRKMDFNIYNIGTQAATPSSNWAFYYLYYNAYNANDYGILYYDQFNTSVSANTYYCPTTQTCNFNFSIPANSSFAAAVFGMPAINRTYYVPSNLNGYYYLVLYADATGKFAEQNEQNNFFYTTNQTPKLFTNGYSQRQTKREEKFQNELNPTAGNLKGNVHNTAVTDLSPNAYTPEEIGNFLIEQKKSGALQKKINDFVASEKQHHPYQ